MLFNNPLGSAAAMLLLLGSYFLPESWVSDSIRYFALGYIGFGLILHVIAGYRRRRPFWTGDSWRRYLAASAIPIASLVIMFTMTALVDRGHPIAGDNHSTARTIWAAGILVLVLVGAGGLVAMIHALHDGEASEPFSLPAWARGRRPPAG